MVEFIKAIADACKDNPNFTFLMAIIAIQLFILFRNQIKILILHFFSDILRKKFNIKVSFTPKIHNEMIKVITSYTSDLGLHIDFKSHLVCNNITTLKESLEYIIAHSRDSGAYLILNFGCLEETSDTTIHTIKNVLTDAMDKNNVRMTVIYPNIPEEETDKEKKYIRSVFQELRLYCKFKSKTIEFIEERRFKNIEITEERRGS